MRRPQTAKQSARPHGEGMVSVDQEARLRYPRRATVTINGPLRSAQACRTSPPRRPYRRKQLAMLIRASLGDSVVLP
jgi:hypothetical protein